jgi:hypothetical protein
MTRLLIALTTLVVSCPGRVRAQEDASHSPQSFQEERRRDSDLELQNNSRIEGEDRSPDLWYGTPGVRAGGDWLVPLIDLIRRPSSFLDFRPRKVPSYLPDLETAEFLRERR